MKAATDPTLRDPAKTADHYAHVIAAARDAIEAYTRYENPVLFASAIPHFLRIGSALYSAGAAVEPCLAVFQEAAQLQLRFIIEGRRFQFLGRGGIDNYLELYSAAHLAGCSTELIGALRQCTYAEQPAPWLPRLIDQFCDVLLGRPVDTDAAQAAELGKVDARVAVLPGLFRAVSHQDLIATTAALESYLAHWGPPIERQAKKDLNSPKGPPEGKNSPKGPPEGTYCGKWCYLSAALCQRLGQVPGLSPKARLYVPVELVRTGML